MNKSDIFPKKTFTRTHAVIPLLYNEHIQRRMMPIWKIKKIRQNAYLEFTHGL